MTTTSKSIDLGRSDPPVFSGVHGPRRSDLSGPGQWLGFVHRPTYDHTGIESFADLDGRHAHDAFHRFTRCPLRYDGWWKLLTVLLVETFVVQGTIEPDLDDPLFHRWGRKVWCRRLVVRCGSVPPEALSTVA